MKQATEIEIIEDFKFAHRGCDVVEYTAGQVIEADAELHKIATENNWAKPAEAKPAAKVHKAAPHNKNAGNSPENKSE